MSQKNGSRALLMIALVMVACTEAPDDPRPDAQIAAPDASVPEPTDPEPTDPEPTDPEPTDPEPTDPEPTDPEPTDPEPTDPEPTDPPTGVETLGPLPAEMAELRWPEQPRITREVTVTTAAQASAEAGVAGTRIFIEGARGGDVSVGANDVEIIADDATSLGRLGIGRGVARVRVEGGTWSAIHLALPAQYYPTVEHRPEWMVEDVTIEGVHVIAPDMAFEIRGRRIAILRSRADAVRYSVWCGDTGPMQSEDVILHENVFVSSGPEATVRLVQVLRSATIDNTLSNTGKHNYRIHGRSDLNYAADNLLVGTGVMLGRMPDDDLGRVWFDDNVFHHTAPDLFNPESTIDALHATGNVAHTNVWDCFYCGSAQPGWTLSGNEIRPYTPPPAF